ncbi:uncharacterized protein BJ212DRAFT_1566252 [Suillus subaureus]|uniref:Microbial-type PARG catalytic domain-containing protein n=1 Tax=Suillus subaureus TaxID=48587 RepID=A0A9P7EL64_9AGAM|nr:uncharacterized protein BJ212DRAFT_1566252 [Suillus subaureus]KAG1824416.1 hypothetical protein BJ212DRAFT_1566252 [Suillus subaureus]
MSVQTKPAFQKTGLRTGGGRRNRLQEIAQSTMDAIENGTVTIANVSYDLAAKVNFSNHNTRYYAPDSLLSTWSTSDPPRNLAATKSEVSILEISTLDGARLLFNTLSSRSTSFGRIAILNFASATRPGGGFLNGAQAQEESIARSSTLYPSLMTDSAQRFYRLHTRDRNRGFYHHAMVYTPSVVILKDDAGNWTSPFEVDVLTSAAVNAGDSELAEIEKPIESVMKERMARILFLFEQQGAKNIVLGSFGTGVFQNDVKVVAKIWAELLTVKGARYRHSFDRVVFAILGKDTFTTFEQSFEKQTSTDTIVIPN